MTANPGVSAALAAWRAASPDRVDPDGPTLWVPIGVVRVPVPNPKRLPAHDLHHLLLGADTDLWGEIQVSTFELRTGPPTAFILALCVAAVAAGLLLAPRLTLRAWRRAAGCRNAYGAALDGCTVAQARAWTGLPA